MIKTIIAEQSITGDPHIADNWRNAWNNVKEYRNKDSRYYIVENNLWK